MGRFFIYFCCAKKPVTGITGYNLSDKLKLKNMNELTIQDAAIFWEYIDEKYPEIGSQLKSRSFFNEAIIAPQPAKMKDEDYKKYEALLRGWLKDNGFM